MKSRATTRFWFLYEQLPPTIKKLAVKNYDLWRKNPRHPSLFFKKLHRSRFTERAWQRG